MIVGLISGFHSFTQSRKNFTVASVPLDDSVTLGTGVRSDLELSGAKAVLLVLI